MLKALTTHLKKYKTFLLISFSLFLFLLGLILYFHRQETISRNALAKLVLVQEEQHKCYDAYVRLQSKIHGIDERRMDQEIAFQILVIYELASKLAQENDPKCLMLEQWGDDVWKAYLTGVVDGKKNIAGGV